LPKLSYHTAHRLRSHNDQHERALTIVFWGALALGWSLLVIATGFCLFVDGAGVGDSEWVRWEVEERMGEGVVSL
jgi:hypothetical protein